jgi:choline dehydrogenase
MLPREDGFSLTVYQGSPFSRGSIRLRSPDPLHPPLIDPGYFSDPRDLTVLRNAVQRMRDVMRQPAIARYIRAELRPGPDVDDDRKLEASIRAEAATSYHPCGACAMGGSEQSVVDPSLRVRGVDGLRVADNSIIPRIPNAALYAPALMIGEYAAALIAKSATP